MTNIKVATGADFALTFTPGLPTPLTGPNVYLLYDGSLAMGELDRDTNGKQWLHSLNPVGMTPLDIAANKNIGWAPAGPRRGVFD
jgi:hypothetical protein